VSPQEFTAAWGADDLLPVASSALQAVPLSEPSRHFLEEAGLPQEAKPNLTFYPLPDALAPLPDVLEEVDLPLDYRRYLLLADDGGTFLCIDARENGHIVSVDAYQELPTRFVNTTVSQFAECLLAYRALPGTEQAKGASKHEIRGWLSQLRDQFNGIDAEALRDADNWWSVITEELEVFTR